MKNIFYRHYILLVTLCSASILNASNATPYFSIRSQSVDTARKLAGWADKINMYLKDECENYFVGSATYEYTRSFRSDQLARCLFGASCIEGCTCPTIKVSGSGVASRGERDWLADNFYLPTDYQSLVSLRPRIENHIIDFNMYWGWDECCEGLYFWVQLPAVYTKWNLNYCEEIIDSGSASYVEGYFSSLPVTRGEMANSFSGYISQEETLSVVIPTSTAPLNLNAQSLKYSKWADCETRLNQTKLSDVHLTLGWNMWQCEDYHLGLNFKVAVPTGNRPKGEWFFEPIVGNGHHWEVGGGVSFHDIYWRGCDDQAWSGFFLEAAITHLFKDKQFRVFDLNNSCNSRYMLAMKLDETSTNNPAQTRIGPDANSAVNAFAQVVPTVAPVANITRTLVNVSYDVQADITAMFSSGWCNWTWDLGYNVWVRSCEKLNFDSCSPCIERPLLNNATWVLKGDSQIIGYDNANSPVFLQVSQSQATLQTGTNRTAAEADSTFIAIQNPGVDNAQNTFNVSNDVPIVASIIGGEDMLSSAEPVFLSYEDVNIKGARTRGVSHKVFTHFNYNWEMDECGYEPYLGAGAMVEWGKTSRDKQICDPLCNETPACKHCALSQWGIWLKGGFSYN